MEIVENSKKLELMQSVLFEIICDIDDFCTENNIRYYLSGGSCIGAVRHNGFIPWDDDVDIMMPRKDYMKFLKTFGKAYEAKYGLSSCEIDKAWVRPFARVWRKGTSVVYKNVNDKEIGIFADIMPIDGLPDGRLARKFFYKKLQVLEIIRNSTIRKAFVKDEKYRTIKKIMGLFTKHLSARGIALRMNLSARKYDFDTSNLVGVSLAVHYWDRETIERKHMAEAVRVDFCGRKLPIPVGYDTYLSNLYGDYMVIPDKEHQITHNELYTLKVDTNEIKY